MNQNKVRDFFNNSNYLGNSSDRICIRAELVKDFLGPRRNVSILDIGCGDGSLSLPMLDHSNHLTLVDISKKMLDEVDGKIPEEFKDNVTLVNDSFDSIKDDDRYDIVICVGVVAHVPDVERLWRKIGSVLSIGGLLIVETTPNPYPLGKLLKPYYFIRSFLIKDQPTYAKNRLKVPELQARAKALGLRQRYHVRYSFPLPTMSHWPHSMKLRYTRFTLTNSIMSRLSTEHVFMFERVKSWSSLNSDQSVWSKK